MDIKTKLYVTKYFFDNDLVVIPKYKVTLILNKPAYVCMCMIDLNKVLMYEFYYDYIKNIEQIKTVLHPDVFWAYQFLEVKERIV